MFKHIKARMKTQKNEPKSECVYTEMIEMLTGSVMIYTFAQFCQDLAEHGVDLKPPFTGKQVMEVMENHDLPQGTQYDDLLERLRFLQQPQERHSTVYSLLSSLGGKSEKLIVTNFGLADKELVHAIVVNHVRQRVTIVFRGSVTPQDFLQDAKCVQKKVENPYPCDGLPETMNIHTGFYQYLFQSTEATPHTTRFDEILDQTKEQVRRNPSYSLYITGHSLGGALATICGVYMASNTSLVPALTNRVVVYSIASPYCGNWKFRQVHYMLERTSRLRHLRIANREDIVTLLPFCAPKAAFLSPALAAVTGGGGNLYKHAGMTLQLRSGEAVEHKIAYPKEHDCENEEDYRRELEHALQSGKHLLQALCRLLRTDFATVEEHHSCDEYERRLERLSSLLRGTTLDELYADPAIVGNIFRDDYKPKERKSALGRTREALAALTTRQKRDEEAQVTLPQAAEEEATAEG